jgi:hypothetical protein
MTAVAALLKFLLFGLLLKTFVSCDVISDTEVIDAVAEEDHHLEDKDRTDRDTPISYQGAQLWRVSYNNQISKNAVSELQKQYQAAMWNLQMANKTTPYVDMFVKRAAVVDAKKFMKQTRVPFDVLIEDVQGVIDTENPPLDDVDLWINRDGESLLFESKKITKARIRSPTPLMKNKSEFQI